MVNSIKQIPETPPNKWHVDPLYCGIKHLDFAKLES